MKPGTSSAHASFAFLCGVALVLGMLLLGVMGALWTPYHPQAIDIPHRLAAFSSAHWLGTDHFGRDVVSQLLAGLGTSLLVASGAVVAGFVIGTALGLTAALSKSALLDRVTAQALDFMFVFPALLTAVMLATLYGPSILNAIIAIAIFNVPVFFRLSRALARSLLSRDYVRAARALGQTPFGLLRLHLLPGSAGVLITQFSTQLGMALLAEAALSYLGLGVPAPMPSLGRMLQDAQTYMASAPRLALLPGGLIALTVLGFNLLGDGLRDRLDTRRAQTF